MLLIHRSVELHQQVADVEKNLRLFSKMIGPHFFDQADGAVLDRVELDGIEREQIFLIFGITLLNISGQNSDISIYDQYKA